MHIKYANAKISDVRYSETRIDDISPDSFSRLASSPLSEDGYLYVQTRAISSRVNKNGDGWPSTALKEAYSTFEGRPVFVDHNNDDPDRTRGVVVWSNLHIEDDLEKISTADDYYASAPNEHLPPTWIELLIEVDAQEFPKLAKRIVDGDIDAVSMGANIEATVCSVCAHKATSPSEYCAHIKKKGAEFEIESSTGEKIRKRSYEDCYGVNFFEISFVFDPADETALIRDIRREGAVYDYEEEEDFQAVAPTPDPTPSPNAGRGDERAWRVEQFMKMGYPPDIASQLADAAVDWHKVKRLLDMGATKDQALRIMTKTAGPMPIPCLIEIGEPQREYIVEPLISPIPAPLPEPMPEPSPMPEPEREPVPEREPEKVPARAGRNEEPVYGWKVLSVSKDGLLESPSYRVTWPNDKWLKASGAPNMNDSRGIHALVTGSLGSLSDYAEATENFALVKVAMAGKIIECSSGYRSEYAYPAEIFVSDTSKIGAIRSQYPGVEISVIPDSIASQLGIKETNFHKGSPYPGHHDKNKDGDKDHIQGAPEKVNEIYHALRRDYPGYSKEKAAKIAWSRYKKMKKKGVLDLKKAPTQGEKDNEPQAYKPTAPEKVDTLRHDFVCPNCGSDMEELNSGQVLCEVCGFEKEPDGFDNPDLEMAKEVDLRQNQEDIVKQRPVPEQTAPQPLPAQAEPPLQPVPPVAPIARVSAVVETVMGENGGLHGEAMRVIAQNNLRGRIIAPYGEFDLPAGRDHQMAFMSYVLSQRKAGKNMRDVIASIPITVEAADDETLNQILTIIHSGGMEGPRIDRETTGKITQTTEVIDEMNVTKKSVRLRKPIVWAGIDLLRKKADGGKGFSDDEQLLVEELALDGVKATPWEAAAAIESFARVAARQKKIVVNNTTKTKGSDEPTVEKVKKDQLAPVESDRKVIKRTEEDGQGVKRTEEIIEEGGPLGSESEPETKAETKPEKRQVKDDKSEEPQAYEDEDEDEDEESGDRDREESKLLAALRLAKFASELGIIDSTQELNWAAELEDNESLVEIEARSKMLESVKEAGLSKSKKRPAFPRFPSLTGSTNGNDDEDIDDISRIFLS